VDTKEASNSVQAQYYRISMSFPDWQGKAIRSRGSAMPQRGGAEKPAMRNTCNLHVRVARVRQRQSTRICLCKLFCVTVCVRCKARNKLIPIDHIHPHIRFTPRPENTHFGWVQGDIHVEVERLKEANNELRKQNRSCL